MTVEGKQNPDAHKMIEEYDRDSVKTCLLHWKCHLQYWEEETFLSLFSGQGWVHNIHIFYWRFGFLIFLVVPLVAVMITGQVGILHLNIGFKGFEDRSC